MTGTVQEMVAHNRGRFVVEAYGQGEWIIAPLSGRSHSSEHSERFSSLGAASAARDRGNFSIKIWGDDLAPLAS